MKMKRKKPIVKFKRTDELGVMLKGIARDYFAQRGVAVRRDQLRRSTKQLMVAVESGVKKISLSDVQARGPRDAQRTAPSVSKVRKAERLLASSG